MQTTIRKVGNSRGVLIPAAFLAACGIGTEIEMRQEGRRIIIEPMNSPPRLGWFDTYKADKDVQPGRELPIPRLKARSGNGETQGSVLGKS